MRWVLKSTNRSWGLYFRRAFPDNSVEWTGFESMAASFESEEEAIQAAHSLGIHRVTEAVEELDSCLVRATD